MEILLENLELNPPIAVTFIQCYFSEYFIIEINFIDIINVNIVINFLYWFCVLKNRHFLFLVLQYSKENLMIEIRPIESPLRKVDFEVWDIFFKYLNDVFS